MWIGDEPASAVRVALLLGIVGCVAGLKLTHERAEDDGPRVAGGACIDAGAS